MNVDIKTLINPDVPRYTNLLNASNSQKLLSKIEPLVKELKSVPKTIYLKEEQRAMVKLDRRSHNFSRQNIVRTSVRQTP
jgi:hypothetical protein